MADRNYLAGALADRYTLEREIGAGGMATVYLAQEVAGDRKVAIKVLRSDLAAVLGTERFLREIQIAAKLDHPHVVGLLDSGTMRPAPGETESGLYYVMPYIDGESLRDRMLREPQFPLDTTINIARQIADVLDYAHSNGLVHRDIKPENILLEGDQVFVTDFGIARAVGTAGGTRLTETGLTVGTPAYMSPEQSLSETIDARTDVYALGCVVYEMLVGEPPYTGPTAQAIIARRLSERVPSIRVVRDALPKSVEEAIHKALARTPADRFATAGEFVTALATLSNESAQKPRRRVGLIAAALVAVAAVAGWFAFRSAPAASAKVIAILPLSSAPATDTTLAQLGRALVSTLSAELGQVSGIRTVNMDKVMGTGANGALAAYGPAAIELGRKVGARSVLLGNLRGMGNGNVQIDLKLLAADSSSDTLAVVSVTGRIGSVAALTDSLSLKLLRHIWRRGSPPSPSLASITTRSIPALAAFLQGERLSTAGQWADAALSYEAAFRLDTTFWLAGWRRNEAQQWIPGDGDPNDSLQRKVEAHRASFGERDRLLIEAEMTAGTEPFAAHLKRFQDISERFPTDWAAVWPYADHLVHSGVLVGYTTGAAMRLAIERAVTLNPKLTNAWEHLYSRSVGRDSGQSERALGALMALGDTLGPYFFPILRLAAMADSDPPAPAFDSAVKFVRRTPKAFGVAINMLGGVGFPGRQLALDRLLLRDLPGDSVAAHARVLASMAFAWGARGVWDSAVVAEEKSAAISPRATPVDVYRLATLGRWLGGLPLTDAAAQRDAATRYVAEHANDPGAASIRSRLIWCNALLAILQSDTAALATQRKALRAVLGSNRQAIATDRTLAAFELLLRNRKRAAADSLAAIDLDAMEADVVARQGFARSVDHLAGAQLLLQFGDTTRALKLLTWCDADAGDQETFLWFAPIADLWQGRIADAQHRKADAIYYYRQFLQRYDVPTPANRQIIDEANRALARLFGLAEPGRTP